MWGYPPWMMNPMMMGTSPTKEQDPFKQWIKFQKWTEAQEDNKKKKEEEKKKNDKPKPRVFSFVETFMIASLSSIVIGPLGLITILNLAQYLKGVLNATLR